MPVEKMQDALKPQQLKRPMDKSQMGGEVAALNSLLSLLNNPNITGAEVPKEEKELLDRRGATMIIADPVMASDVPESSHRRSVLNTPTQPQPIARAASPLNASKIFYTGLIGAGKDYIAAQTGATIFGFADSLYHLAEYFFGVTVNATEGKTLPGIRAFLQAAGQWGRGERSEQYPFTPARACFVSMIRSLGEADRFDKTYAVNWSEYGRNKDIWLDAVSLRVGLLLSEKPDTRVAITNVRFVNEYKRLQELGWTHYHVMASPETRAKRVPVGGKSTDMSEGLANALNNDAMKKISQQPRGAKFRVIWNDTVPSPSPRLYSVAEFLHSLSVSTSIDETMVVTGE